MEQCKIFGTVARQDVQEDQMSPIRMFLDITPFW